MASSYSPDHSLEREISFLGVSLIECGRPEEMATIKKKKKRAEFATTKTDSQSIGCFWYLSPCCISWEKKKKKLNNFGGDKNEG